MRDRSMFLVQPLRRFVKCANFRQCRVYPHRGTQSEIAVADIDAEQADARSRCDRHENNECSFHDIAPKCTGSTHSMHPSGKSGNAVARPLEVRPLEVRPV